MSAEVCLFCGRGIDIDPVSGLYEDILGRKTCDEPVGSFPGQPHSPATPDFGEDYWYE